MVSRLKRLHAGTVYGIGVSVLALILLYLGVRPGVSSVSDRVGDAVIQFAADRPWLTAADDCVQLIWHVSGIREVHLNDDGVVGEGQVERCKVLGEDIRLTVGFVDGKSKSYHLDLRLSPLFNTQSWFFFVSALTALAAGFALLFPALCLQVVTRIQNGASRAAAFFASELGLNLILLFGVVVRVSQYLYNRAAWGDEAALMLNILDRSYGQLWQPLDTNQAAPIGFLMLEKLANTLLGMGEQAFRFVPLLVSILALFVFKGLSQRFLDRKVVPLALVFFVGAQRLLYYSVEVKQYSTDVLVGLLILVLYFAMQAKPITLRRALLWGVCGALAIWFSHPAIFVLAGAALVLLYNRLRSQATIPYLLIGVFCVWAASFGANYFISLRVISRTGFLNAFWEFAFAPVTIQAFPAWFAARITAALQQAVFITPLLSVTAFIFGLIVLFRVRRNHFLIIVMPIMAVLAAAIIRSYAFADRLILFTIPFFIWGVVVGIASLFKFLPKLARAAAYALIILPLIATDPQIPPNTPDERPLITYMKEHAQATDSVYLAPSQDEVYKYYSRVMDLQVARTLYGGMETVFDGRNTFAPHERIWIYRSGAPSNTQTWDQTIAYFKGYATQIGEYKVTDDTGVALFELGEAPPQPKP